MPAWFNAVWPVVTFTLGLASTYLTSFINEKRQISREAKAREAEREKAVTDRRETFELDHLVRLNEALQDLARAAAQAHLADMRVSRETGHYASTLLPEGISDTFHQAGRTVRMLKNVVLDDALRDQVTKAAHALHVPSMMMRAEPGKAERAFFEATELVEAAQEAVAQRIREIYASAEA
ncbi:hypothetical protein OJ963_40580 [Streptomyces sp. RS2]|uniref:hypothetical protein n=1 Tax=Streptomyces sp. RS2 TaxID=1451205 RepID=UPI0021F90574|nr:hypothetical protein [Streptomyces sp. RS2]MCW1100088.1 hypothetical protein [Streptomyces sp. RS2]